MSSGVDPRHGALAPNPAPGATGTSVAPRRVATRSSHARLKPPRRLRTNATIRRAETLKSGRRGGGNTHTSVLPRVETLSFPTHGPEPCPVYFLCVVSHAGHGGWRVLLYHSVARNSTSSADCARSPAPARPPAAPARSAPVCLPPIVPLRCAPVLVVHIPAREIALPAREIAHPSPRNCATSPRNRATSPRNRATIPLWSQPQTRLWQPTAILVAPAGPNFPSLLSQRPGRTASATSRHSVPSGTFRGPVHGGQHAAGVQRRPRRRHRAHHRNRALCLWSRLASLASFCCPNASLCDKHDRASAQRRRHSRGPLPELARPKGAPSSYAPHARSASDDPASQRTVGQ